MKTHLLSFLFLTAWLHAEDPATLIEPIIKPQITNPSPAPARERLEVTPDEIISSKVVIRDGQKFTLQEIQPQELTPLPAPPLLKPLTSTGQKHFDLDADHYLIVNGGSADLPALAYDSFFFNSCESGRDYIEVFTYGTMFYTGALCSDGDTSRVYVESIINGKSGNEVLQSINVEENVNYMISR